LILSSFLTVQVQKLHEEFIGFLSQIVLYDEVCPFLLMQRLDQVLAIEAAIVTKPLVSSELFIHASCAIGISI